jgi:hypothetical protein
MPVMPLPPSADGYMAGQAEAGTAGDQCINRNADHKTAGNDL